MPDEETLSRRGIRRIDLVASPTADYVAYDASFELDLCPTTGDSALDSPSVENALRNSLDLSLPNATPGTGSKNERGGVIFKRVNGTIGALVVTDPAFATSTECNFSLVGNPPLDSGAFVIGEFHTHPTSDQEDVYQCIVGPNDPPLAQALNDGKLVPKAAPDDNGGGSPSDWLHANSTMEPSYVINKDGRVYKLVQNTPVSQWSANPNKWEWKNPSVPGCMSSLP